MNDSKSPFAALRARAEQEVVYPLNRDECLALVEVAERAHAYAAEMAKVAHEWRMDWSDFDGRTLMRQEKYAAESLHRAFQSLLPPLSVGLES